MSELPSESPQELLFVLCDRLAKASAQTAPEVLGAIKRALNVQSTETPDGECIDQVASHPDFDINEPVGSGLRPLDVLCRGQDSEEACFALMHLMQAGADATTQPNPSEAAPLHATAFYGNASLLCTLLDMGVDAGLTSNGTKQQLLGSTALHAVATGFRAGQAQNYADCFSALLGAGCNVDAKDRKRQTPIDIAMRSAASTGSSELVDAILDYGVVLDGTSNQSAMAVAQALSKRTGSLKLVAQISASAFGSVARSLDALRAAQGENVTGKIPSP